jgi:starch-binding outer membrane protein SusE/F
MNTSMKKISSLLTALLIFTAWSCEEKENMDPLGNWEIGAATLKSPAANASVVLNEAVPTAKVKFEWDPAVTSNRFIVGYTVVLVPAASDDYANPILKITPTNGGKDLFAEVTAEQIDYALWAKCYPAGQPANLKWVVMSKAIEKQTVAAQNISFTRFATDRVPSTLFITGSGTEKGSDPTQAIEMRALVDGDEEQTHVFDVYTKLTAGETYQFRDQANTTSKIYGGNAGTLAGCGPAIAVSETAVYRVTVNLNDNTYQTFKVDKWSLVGDAVEGGWGGDVPLTYQGNGLFTAKINMYKPYPTAGFIFRANGDWGYLLKRIKGTGTGDLSGDVVMESEGNANGVEFEDMPGPEEGLYMVTLNLAPGAWKYTLVKEIVDIPQEAIIGKTTDPNGNSVSGNFIFGEYDVPGELYLISDGAVVGEFTKDGDKFTSKYLALQQSKTYKLNSASDGSGITYNEIGDGTITVDHDQAYKITVDFSDKKLVWQYYNLKLFHWDEVGGGWDQRQELLMTYSHPYKFEVTGTLSSGFHSKFISPWEVQFGTSATALSGTMTNGGANYTGINSNGTYKANITVSDDYSECTFAFVKQ